VKIKGIMGLLLLTLGVGIAAASGARNGADLVANRQAKAKLAAAQELVDVVDEGRKLNQTLKEEGFDLATMTFQEHQELQQNDERLAEMVERTQEALKKTQAWGMPAEQPPVLVHLAERELAAAALPPPSERLAGWFAVGGVGWLVGIVLIVCGAVLARMQQAEDNAGSGAGAAGRLDFDASIADVRARVAAIRTQIADLAMDADAPGARDAIDRLTTEVLEPIVEARGQLIARHGLAGFAEYFGPYSAGERNVNRAWSALTDGHAVVAREALESADAAFEAAQSTFASVDGRR
jgi:hypothetical protein